MLSLSNTNENSIIFSTPVVFIILVIITLIRIYSLFISPIELSVDEAQYWHWSQNLDYGYFTKPPLIAWAIALSTNIFGNEEWAVRLFSPIIHFFISIILWAITQFAFGLKAGRIAALLWIFTPAASLGSFIISTDTPLLLFWSSSLLFIFKIFKDDSYISATFSGASLGLAFLSKYAALYFFVLLILWWVIYDKGKALTFKKLLVVLISSIFVATPNLYWNYSNDFVTASHTISNANLSEIIMNYANVIDFLSSQLLVFGPIIFLLYLFIIFNSFFKDQKLSLLGMLSLPIITLIIVQSFLKIANPNWAVTAYISATLMISAYAIIQKHRVLRLLTKFGLIINFVLSLLILKITLTGNFYPIHLKSDPLRKNLGFEILSTEIKKSFDNKEMSKLVFMNRGEITRFNYYLIKIDNKFKNKIFLKTKSIFPGNFYEKNYNYDKKKHKKDEKIMIIKRDLNFGNDFANLTDTKFIRKISTNTIKGLKRTYYLFEGIVK